MTGESEVRVTQADREAAVSILQLSLSNSQERAVMIAAGELDGDPLVQILARHREASTAPLLDAIEAARAALGNLCFPDMGEDEDEGVRWETQEVWQTIYRDRVQDWFSYEDLDAAREALARLTAKLAEYGRG
jgi:hypothetical protein